MKLSSQEEYGLRCLLQVALHRGDDPLTIPLIAEREGLSPEYTGKLLRVLRQGGLVVSTRGNTGGYHLARPADEITLHDAIVVLDGPLFAEGFCEAHTGNAVSCVHSETSCSVRALWRWMGAAIDKVLRTLTLADLAGGSAGLGNALTGAERGAPRQIRVAERFG